MNNLGNQVRSGFGWDMFGTFFKQVSTFTISIILARLLTPEQFGLVAMATIAISLSQVFIDVGFTQGLIQSEENTPKTYSSVFYITICLGLIMSVLIFLLSPFIGDYFNDEDLDGSKVTELIKWLSIIPFLASLGSVHNAIFIRDLKFKLLAFRLIITNVIAGILGITLALLDYGVYALVFQQLLATVLYTFILWWKSDWKPTYEFSFVEIKELLNFSGYVFLNNVLRRIFLKIDTIFIGKYFSAETLGFYSKAESLNSQVTQYTTGSLRSVLFPAFSKIQKNIKLFEETYFKVFNISIFLGTIASGSLFILSELIIINLIGEIWRPSVFIFQVLVFRIVLSPYGALINKSLLAKGLSKQTFQVAQVRRVILIMPLFIGYFYNDINAFAVAIVIADFIGFFISTYSTYKYLKISFYKQIRRFFVPSLPLFVLVFINYYLEVDINPFLLLFIFLTIQISYNYLLKDEGMILSLELIKKIKSKK